MNNIRRRKIFRRPSKLLLAQIGICNRFFTLAPLFICATSTLVTVSCSALTSVPSKLKADGAIHVIRVTNSEYSGKVGDPLQAACQDWQLSPHQIVQFFTLSKQYAEAPYESFYQVPCLISGTIEVDGKVWDFEIHGGATGTWQSGQTVRHWGCSDPGCSDLVLLPTDFMSPD